MEKRKFEWLREQGIEVSAVLVDSGVKFPNTDKFDKTFHNMFEVTIVRDGIEVKMPFYGSHKDWGSGVDLLDEENLFGAFECFVSDALAGDQSFEEFCSSFGYNEDSRKAEKIWKECEKISSDYSKLFSFTEWYDKYELYNKLQDL